jgi:hypothetical protein
MKPRAFVGSSSEQVDTAYAIQRNLERSCDVTAWDQGVFQLTSNTLDDLIALLERTNFGIFVFGSNDLTTIRNAQYQSTRDNVVFEFGLFIGKLGKSRTFFVMPRERGAFRLPSDLVGTTPAEFDETREDRQTALGPACSAIRQRIDQLGIRANRVAQPMAERIAVRSVLCISSPGNNKRPRRSPVRRPLVASSRAEFVAAKPREGLDHSATAGRRSLQSRLWTPRSVGPGSARPYKARHAPLWRCGARVTFCLHLCNIFLAFLCYLGE